MREESYRCTNPGCPNFGDTKVVRARGKKPVCAVCGGFTVAESEAEVRRRYGARD